MKPKAVNGYEYDGEFICKEDLGEVVTWYECSECGEVYEDREEAKDCCKE